LVVQGHPPKTRVAEKVGWGICWEMPLARLGVSQMPFSDNDLWALHPRLKKKREPAAVLSAGFNICALLCCDCSI
jgi:hypothetical protein